MPGQVSRTLAHGKGQSYIDRYGEPTRMGAISAHTCSAWTLIAYRRDKSPPPACGAKT